MLPGCAPPVGALSLPTPSPSFPPIMRGPPDAPLSLCAQVAIVLPVTRERGSRYGSKRQCPARGSHSQVRPLATSPRTWRAMSRETPSRQMCGMSRGATALESPNPLALGCFSAGGQGRCERRGLAYIALGTWRLTADAFAAALSTLPHLRIPPTTPPTLIRRFPVCPGVLAGTPRLSNC